MRILNIFYMKRILVYFYLIFSNMYVYVYEYFLITTYT